MTGTRTCHPIDVMEACYSLEEDARTWVRRLASSVRPLLDGGHGISAYTYDVRKADFGSDLIAIDVDPEHAAQIARLQKTMPELAKYLHLQTSALMTLGDTAERGGFAHPLVGGYFDRAGLHDHATLQAVQPRGTGIVFTAGQRERRSFDRRTQALWARVAAHVAAGHRLRTALAPRRADGDALLTPTGRLEHAEPDARSPTARAALREAVMRRERARSRGGRDEPESATEAWAPLVTGRWSLVDRFERGGRRYLVALRNEHDPPDPRALTRRERAVAHLAALGRPNKLIGYELGLAESTVSTHLSSAVRKLGSRSRNDLVLLVRQLAEQG